MRRTKGEAKDGRKKESKWSSPDSANSVTLFCWQMSGERMRGRKGRREEREKGRGILCAAVLSIRA